MTDFPDLKMKAVVQFPARVLDGTGIDIIKSNGSYQFNLDFGDFAPPVTTLSDPTHQNALMWNNSTGQYSLVSATVLTGSAVFPATAFPLIESGSGAIGSSAKYAREDHVHPISGNTFQQSGTGAINRTPQDKMRERVSVTDFSGVDPTGVTDSAAGIQSAINSLAVTGGDVYFPPGIYKINVPLQIGDGTGTVASTRQGIRLYGGGVAGATNLFTGFGLPTTTAVKLLWNGAVNGNMMLVAGSLEGWGVNNIIFDGNSTAGNGIIAYNASFGDCTGLTFQNIKSVCLTLTTFGTGSNAMHNTFRNTTLKIPDITNATAILLDGVINFSNACFNTFINTTIWFTPAVNAQTGIKFRLCDTNYFENTHMFGGGVASALVFDYSTGSTAWPCSNGLFGIDHASGGTAYVNIGTPPAGILAGAANYIYGLGQGNGAIPPNIDGLAYIAPYNMGGTRDNSAAVAGAIGEEIKATNAFPGSALTTATPLNIVSIVLTKGDWDISASAYFVTAASTTVTKLIATISTTSGTLFQSQGFWGQLNFPALALGNDSTSVTCGPTRVSIATTTTYYLVAQSTFATSTNSCFAILRARRMR